VANGIWNRTLCAFTIAAAVLSGAVAHTSAGTPDKSDRRRDSTSMVPESARAAYFRLPLRFEPATAQTR